jgi:hypothetical protein
MRFFKYIFLTLITLLSIDSFSQTMPTSGSNVGASSGTWTVPANVYSIKIDAWGGGGAGAGQSTSGTGGFAGGAGGARSTTTISVTPGQTIYYNVGAARAGIQGNAADGNDTWVSKASNAAPTVSTNGVVAKGGKSAVGTTQGTGSNTGCIGTSNRGGSGRVGGASSGGGGSSAGTTLNGVDATGTAGATAPAGGGNGGGGHASGGNGTAGSAPGGGGGGAYKNNTTARTGGGGAAGRVILTYQAVPNCATPTPSNGATNVSTSQTLSWAAVSGATSYDVYFGSTSTPTFIQNQAGTTYNPGTLNATSTYYWQVIPKNAAGSAVGCSVWSFTTKAPGCLSANYGLYPSTTYTPSCVGTTENITTTGYAGEYSNVSLTSGVSYTFSSSVATDYITIGNSDGTTVLSFGTSPVVWTSTLTGTVRFYTHTNDACTDAMVSRTRRIQCSIAPSCTTPSSPTDGATGQSIGSSLNWNSVAAAASYDVYFGTTTNPPFVVNQTGTSYTPSVLSYNTTYYWKIVPKNGAGSAVGCSTWSFSTGGPGCVNATYGQFPSTTYNPNCTGTAENITTNGYAGEYSVVNLISNVQYTMSSSVSTDFITITDAAGSTILAYGTGSLNYTPTTDGDIRFYLHTNESCGSAATGRARRIQCTTPPPPTNDLVANAIDVGLCGGTFTGNTKFATQTGDAPSCYTGSFETWTAPGVWYKVVGNGQNITASLCGSTFDTKIFVYTGTAGSLTCLTYNDDFCSAQSEVTFASTLNTTYHILVTGYGSAKGAFTLNVSLVASPPIISTQPTSGSVCSGQSRTFSVVASGNQGPLSYQWYLGGVAISGANSSSYSASAAGTYYVIVSNSCGSTIQSSNATLTVNALPTITVSSPEICNGFSTQIVAGGGTSYVWSTGATTSTISVSPTSTTNYTVTGTDANGCQSQATSTVTVNPNPQVSLNSTSSTICAGGSGTNNIIATASSGTPTYSYQWQYWNGTSWLNTGTNTNTLNATPTVNREYRVVVSDTKGCQVTSPNHTVTVVPDPVNPTLNTKTPNQIDVCAGTNLSATFNAGTGGVSCGDVYQFSTNGTTWSSYTPGNNIVTSSLSQGATVQIRGRRTNCAASIGCSANSYDILATWSIVTPPVISNLVTNVGCNGGSNGSINLSVSGSTPPYTFSWSGPNSFSASTEDLTGLSAGSYTVNVSVPSGCVSSSTIIVTQPSILQSSLTKTDINCFGNSTGSINLTPTGGTTPYSFSWSNGASTEDLFLLSAGDYSVTITDANGCQSTNSVTISQPAAALSSSSTQQNVLCNGGNTGSIDLSVLGGTSPYTYSWSNGQTTQDVSNITSGNYSVTITDSKSCQITRTFTITQPTALSLSSTSTNVSCNGGSNGSIDLSVSGGTSPYTYSWSNGINVEDLSGISSGSYSVLVTDVNGCQSTSTIIITQPTTISLSYTSTNINCFSSSTGSIDLSVSGGTSPYTYSWSSGQTTQDLNNIPASSYSVTVTDANGCQTTSSVTLTEPTQLTSTFTQINVSCNGGSNGSIDLSVSGGISPYSYSWSNGQTTEDISGLSTGNYVVTITDANGCQTSNSVTITQPSVLSSTSTQFNPSCFGAANGSINLTPTGGTSPYTFVWSNGATTEDIFSLPANTYSVTITDSKGCQATRTVTITQPTQLTSTVTTTNINCYGQNTGSASVVASGGTPPYLYMWNTGNTQTSISNLTAGNYQITVTDNKGCSKITYVTITQPSELSISLNVTSYPNCGSNNGAVSSSVIGGTPPFTYSWSNGSTSQNLTGVASGNYTLTVTDSKGCQSQSSMTLGCTSAVIVVGQISGPSSVCGLNTATYSINYSNAAPDNISWILPNGLSSTNGLNNQNVNVVFSGGFVEDSIEVDVVSNGITYHRSMWISKNPNKPIISGNLCGDPIGSIKQYVVTNSQSNTTYNWVQPYGVNIYTGQSNDTVQFKFSNVFINGSTASVTATNACGSSSTQFKLYKYVTRPTSILGPSTVCADGNTIYTYRVDSVPTSYMYIWAVPNGVSIIGSNYDDTLKVKFSTNFSSGQFSVMSVNQCGSSPMTYGTVSNNNLYANIGSITGPGDLCPYLGQTTTYSVSPQSGTFTWNVPTNMTIQSGQGTNILTVNVLSNFTSGTISVNLNNGCGGSISSSKTLSTTQSTISASSITGPRSVCSLIGTNTPATFSITPISGVNYVWSVPANSTIISGQGTSSINVTFQNGFAGGNIQLVITGGCGNPITRIRTVDLGLPSVNISGVSCVDNGYTNTYSVSVTGALSFNWTAPGNAQIVRGQGTNSIDVFFPANFETSSCSNNSCDSIRLTTQFACGNVISKRRIGLLTVRPSISGLTTACFPDTIRLVASTSPRITSYIWNSPNGVQFIGSTTGNNISAKTSSSFIGGTFSVMGVNTCGSSPMAYFGVNKVCPVPSSYSSNQDSESTSRIETDFIEISKTPIDFITFPNPGRDKVNLRVFKGNSEYYFVQVYNLVGQKVYSGLHESEDVLDLSKLEEGVFFITIEGKEGWKLTRELVISR